MDDRSESVHVHRRDAPRTIEEYREKGFVLKEKTKPSVIAQMGFVKLVFIPAEDAAKEAEQQPPRKRGILFF